MGNPKAPFGANSGLCPHIWDLYVTCVVPTAQPSLPEQGGHAQEDGQFSSQQNSHKTLSGATKCSNSYTSILLKTQGNRTLPRGKKLLRIRAGGEPLLFRTLSSLHQALVPATRLAPAHHRPLPRDRELGDRYSLCSFSDRASENSKRSLHMLSRCMATSELHCCGLPESHSNA